MRTFCVLRATIALLLLSLTACASRTNDNDARGLRARGGDERLQDVEDDLAGSAGASPEDRPAIAAAAGRAGSGGTGSGGAPAATSVAQARAICGAAVVGEACDESFLSPSYELECDADDRDDATCRPGLFCDGDVWRPRDNGPGACPERPLCETATHWDYCRNADGVFCFRNDQARIFCPPEHTSVGGYPLVLPVLGSACEPGTPPVSDCGLEVGGSRYCVQGIWVRLFHPCK